MERGEAQPTTTGRGVARSVVRPRLRAVPWRLVAFGTLGAAATLNRYTITVVGLHAKLEHLAILALLAAFVVYALGSGWRRAGARCFGWRRTWARRRWPRW